MGGQRMSPHWWPEAWRLLAASLPGFLGGRRFARLLLVLAGGAVVGGVGGAWVWLATGGDAATAVAGVVLFALLGVAIAWMICLLVYRRRDRLDVPVDGYVPDQLEQGVRDAIRVGDLTPLPANVRRYLAAKAEQNRAAIPSWLLTDFVSLAFMAVLVVGTFLASGQAALSIIFGILLLLRFFTIGTLLYALGSTTATLNAEARAVAREAEEPNR